jgi:hypothetical protein
MLRHWRGSDWNCGKLMLVRSLYNLELASRAETVTFVYQPADSELTAHNPWQIVPHRSPDVNIRKRLFAVLNAGSALNRDKSTVHRKPMHVPSGDRATAERSISAREASPTMRLSGCLPGSSCLSGYQGGRPATDDVPWLKRIQTSRALPGKMPGWQPWRSLSDYLLSSLLR